MSVRIIESYEGFELFKSFQLNSLSDSIVEYFSKTVPSSSSLLVDLFDLQAFIDSSVIKLANTITLLKVII